MIRCSKVAWPVTILIIGLLIAGCASSAPAPSTSPAQSKSAATSSPAASASAPPSASAKPSAAATTPPPPATVRIGLVNTATDAPALIALEKGYFKEQNITIVDEVFDSASRMIPPLASGQLDVGAGGVSAGLYNSITGGIPVKVVATKGDLIKGANALIARKDLVESGGLKDFKDLKGKTFALNASKNTTQFGASQAVKKGGLTDDDIKWVEMPFPQMIPALVNKSIDLGVAVEPWVTTAKEQGAAVWKVAEDYEAHPGGGLILLYSPNFWQKQEDVGMRFMVAYVKGVRDYIDAMWKKKANREEVIQILMKRTSIKDRAMYEKMTPVTYNQDARVDKISLADNQDWYLERGYQEKRVDLTQVIDDRFTDYALKTLGPYKE